MAIEEFKSLDEIMAVDERILFFVDRADLINYYKSVSTFVLSKTVPDDVQSQFNTAKNVLLYTWFVYGFYPVAQFQALSTLELALQERIGEAAIKKPYGKRRGSLKSYIEYAAKNNWIKNEDFRDCHHAPSDEIKVPTEIK